MSEAVKRLQRRVDERPVAIALSPDDFVRLSIPDARAILAERATLLALLREAEEASRSLAAPAQDADHIEIYEAGDMIELWIGWDECVAAASVAAKIKETTDGV